MSLDAAAAASTTRTSSPAGRPGGDRPRPTERRARAVRPTPARAVARRFEVLLVACMLVGATGFVAADASIASRPATGLRADATPSVDPLAAASAGGAGAQLDAPSPIAATGGTPAPSPSTAPATEPDSAWSSTGIPSFAPTATLVPSDARPAGVAVSTSFTLTSLGDTPATTLAKGISSVPAVEFAVKAGPDSKTAILTPRAPLARATEYRFTLASGTMAVAGSWLFQTSSPLHVASTIPGDQATGVPVDTGIEITFDQDGVGPIAANFSITPAVPGTFERHGRTWVYVAERLAYATIYTVTVREGVTLVGSDQVLEGDVRLTFETAAPPRSSSPRNTAPLPPASLPPLEAWFTRDMLEVPPAEPPLVEVYVEQPSGEDDDPRKPLESVDLQVFRLPGLAAAVEAFRTLTAAPDWAHESDDRLVATAGLPRIGSFAAPIRRIAYGSDVATYLEFPTRLERGWYVIVHPSPGRDHQLLLQVTDVATYLTATTTRSVVWVNDVTAGGPIAGARLWTPAGKAIVTTSANGTATPTLPAGDLFIVTAPDAGRPGPTTVAGRAAIVPMTVEPDRGGGSGGWADTYGGGWYDGEYGWASDDAYWTVLETDRTRYRSTDEVDAWGLVRTRKDGSVPAGLELRVTTEGWHWDQPPSLRRALALARAPVSAGGRTGSFAVPVALRDVPPGWYELELWAGDSLVTYTSFEVGEIAKPSYTLDVSTDRHVLVDGDTVTATVTTSFFDGTPVPELPVSVNGVGADDRSGRTSDEGRLSLSFVASWQGDPRFGSDWRQVSAWPHSNEEAEIPGDRASYVVLPSRLLLEAEARIAGARLLVTGSARTLDQARAEQAWVSSAGTDGALTGPVAAGTLLHVTVGDHWYVSVKTGRVYDFIAKRAYDAYSWEQRERQLVRTDVIVGPDGTFSLDLSRAFGSVAQPKCHHYEVMVSGADGNGRGVAASAYAYAWWDEQLDWGWDGEWRPQLRFVDPPDGDIDFAVGETMAFPLSWRGNRPPSGGSNRYLFLTATNGLQDVVVSSSPTFVHAFSAHDLPNASIEAVWFTGGRYVVGSDEEWVRFDRSDRELTVTLTPDAARHAPGETVTLAVRTVGPDGRPAAATVVVRAIDEKLYAMSAATETSPLDALYSYVWSGILATYASHPAPSPPPGGGDTTGGGDTGGGGGGPTTVRSHFRDCVLFQRITTDASGRGSLSFRLSDDITSWRISGAAFTSDLRAGQSSVSVTAGLPLFIEAPLTPEYLASDRPTVLVRAYGTALRSGQPVTFTVSAPSLGMAKKTATGRAFTAVSVPLPALRPGDHPLRIEASATSGGRTVRDILVRTIRVVESRFTTTRSAYAVLPAPLPVARGTGMTDYVFVDAGRGRYLWDVQRLAWGGGDRVDEALAALIARDILSDGYGLEEDESYGYPYPVDRYQKAPPQKEGFDQGAGIALVWYGSPDVTLSARVGLLAAERFDADGLASYFAWVRTDPSMTREQKILALAGSAGVIGRTGRSGGPSLAGEIAAALRDPSLTVRERLYLALGAATLGDHETAAAAERAVVRAYGERLGDWVRLHVGSSQDDILEATSLLALIAVSVGDPVAEGAEAYVEEHYGADDLYDLQQAGFLRAAVARAPSAAARFEYRVDGVRQVVDLDPGSTYALTLTPSQRATLSTKVLQGTVGVSVRWDEPVAPISVKLDPSLTLTRTVTPASPIPVGGVVTVTLVPKLGDFTTGGCYRVVDLAPSGLRPLAWAWGGTHGSEDVTPWEISGQRVVFCTWPSPSRPARLVYYARVVTPGAYTWEPALMQSDEAVESAALAAAQRIVIR